MKPTNIQRIYVVTSDLIVCQNVFDQIRSENSQTPGLSHHMLVAPFVPISLSNLLEENGKNEKMVAQSKLMKKPN